jgi:hypothetical protein
VPETAIVQIGGLRSVDMPSLSGKASTAEVARYPTALSKYVRK